MNFAFERYRLFFVIPMKIFRVSRSDEILHLISQHVGALRLTIN